MNQMNFAQSKCSIKWDIEVEKAKDIFKELGINFLNKYSHNFDLDSSIRQFTNHFNSSQFKTSHRIYGNKHLKSEPNNDTCINRLSDELLLNIFRYLSHKTLLICCQVSKHWNRIACDSSLWKNIDLSKKYMTLSQLQAILKNGIVCIRLSSATIIDSHLLDTISSLNRIKYLDLSMAQISVQSINQLLDSNFNEISLKKLSLESLTINQKTLDLIVVKHRQLEVLNLSMIQLNDNQVLISFNDKLPETLVELNISWISGLDVDKTIGFLPNSLKRLNISGFRQGLKDQQIATLVTFCPNLIELDLCDSVLLSERSLQSIQTHLTNLEVLHISRCHRITDLSLLMVMKSVKVVSIEGILLNENVDLTAINVNASFISTIARPRSTQINESYSSIWEKLLNIV